MRRTSVSPSLTATAHFCSDSEDGGKKRLDEEAGKRKGVISERKGRRKRKQLCPSLQDIYTAQRHIFETHNFRVFRGLASNLEN